MMTPSTASNGTRTPSRRCQDLSVSRPVSAWLSAEVAAPQHDQEARARLRGEAVELALGAFEEILEHIVARQRGALAHAGCRTERPADRQLPAIDIAPRLIGDEGRAFDLEQPLMG